MNQLIYMTIQSVPVPSNYHTYSLHPMKNAILVFSDRLVVA